MDFLDFARRSQRAFNQNGHLPNFFLVFLILGTFYWILVFRLVFSVGGHTSRAHKVAMSNKQQLVLGVDSEALDSKKLTNPAHSKNFLRHEKPLLKQPPPLTGVQQKSNLPKGTVAESGARKGHSFFSFSRGKNGRSKGVPSRNPKKEETRRRSGTSNLRGQQQANVSSSQALPVRVFDPNGIMGATQASQLTRLDTSIDRRNLTLVFLDFFRYKAKTDPYPREHNGEPCKGGDCPVFSYCYQDFPGVAACTRPDVEDFAVVPTKNPSNCPDIPRAAAGGANSGVSLRNGGAGSGGSVVHDLSCVHNIDFRPHVRWASQVFVLHNVLMNSAGQVFNFTHSFDFNACPAPTSSSARLIYPPFTRVVNFPQLINIASLSSSSASSPASALAHLLPLLLSLDAVIPAMPKVPLVLSSHSGQGIGFSSGPARKPSQLEQLEAIGKGVTGIDLKSLAFHLIAEDELFFAETLIVPLHQRCGRPSRAFWSQLRGMHLLLPDGLPLFSGDFSLPRSPSGRPSGFGDDWVVLVGHPSQKEGPNATPHPELAKIKEELSYLFGKRRVLLVEDGPLPEMKKLFNRARVFVAHHGPLLNLMLFMPQGASVVEMRPLQHRNPEFHHLAEVCDLEYHLVLSNNGMAANFTLLVNTIREIARKVYDDSR